VGGDGASSVDLGDGRILWLFGDSWIDPAGPGVRQGARMVSNSVAIQPDSSGVPRQPLFDNGQSELTIHLDPTTARFLAVQTQGFGAADVMLGAAPTLTGPWSGTRMVYRPPEHDRPNVMIYSAKAHPELAGGNLVLTYDTNTFRFEEQLSDSLIYYPRFVRLTRCR
jgi:hypothetical protein